MIQNFLKSLRNARRFLGALVEALGTAFHYARERRGELTDEDYAFLEPTEEDDVMNDFNTGMPSEFSKLFSNSLEQSGDAMFFGLFSAGDKLVCGNDECLLQWDTKLPATKRAICSADTPVLIRASKIAENELRVMQAWNPMTSKIVQKALKLNVGENTITKEQMAMADALASMSDESLRYLVRLADGSVSETAPAVFWPDAALKAKWLMLQDAYPVAVRELYADIRANIEHGRGKVYQHLERTVTAIDWRLQPFTFDIGAVRAQLNASHYGIDDVKDRVMEALVAREHSKSKHSRAMLLVGPQGVGKSTIVENIAKALRCPCVRLNLNGRNDSSVLTGSARIYDNSEPGIIVNSAERYGSFRYVLQIDELDKCGVVPNGHSENGSADSLADSLLDLMEGSFWDLSLGMLIDTSQILIVATANDASKVNKLLRDRMDVIEVRDYYPHEKSTIAEEFIWPKLMRDYDIPVRLMPEAVRYVVQSYGAQSGVRTLQKKLEAIARHILYEHVAQSGSEYPRQIDVGSIQRILGLPRKLALPSSCMGSANILGVNETGGSVLQVQVDVSPAREKDSLEITGSAESSMQESCRVALRLARRKLPDATSPVDVHIHFSEAGVHKDGASAGVMIYWAIVSQLLQCPLDVALCGTGEVDIKGFVHPVGGIPAKVAAAAQAGMLRMLVPVENIEEARKCLDDRSKLELIPIHSIHDVSLAKNDFELLSA